MSRRLAAALLAVVGGYMTFDGQRALLPGDYLTPRRGPYRGRLGRWAKLVAALGIDPRSTAMKTVFVAVGLAHLAAAVWLALSPDPVAVWVALIVAESALWYLPFGTIAAVAVFALVFLTDLNPLR